MKNILTFESCSFSFCNYLNLDRFVKKLIYHDAYVIKLKYISPLKNFPGFLYKHYGLFQGDFGRGRGIIHVAYRYVILEYRWLGAIAYEIFFSSNIKFFTILRDGVFFLEIIIDYLISHAMECARNCPSRNNLAPFVRAMHNSRFTHF